MKRFLVLALTLLAVFAVGVFPASSNGPGFIPQESISLHLTLGNPSDATDDPTNKDNFLMVKDQYALSYNNSRRGANWVSWHLEKTDVGKAKRLNKFHPDTDLPEGFTRIVTGNYTHSGYERGHLCNSEDRTRTQKDNHATFAMTNILPQAADNNKGPWVKLETFARTLTKQGNEVYIIAGAFGKTGSPISKNKITVPKTFWKVMVVLPKGENDLSRINKDTRAIAVCMPNINGIRPDPWQLYVTTIRKIEGLTGFDFLSELPKSTQDAIETRRDSAATAPPSKNPCK